VKLKLNLLYRQMKTSNFIVVLQHNPPSALFFA
jgi:hypothetical protein